MRRARLVERRDRDAPPLSRSGKPILAERVQSSRWTCDAPDRNLPRSGSARGHSVVDYQKAFGDFDAAGGRRALERQLAELDRVAQASVLEGTEPDSRLMALREGLQRLLAALNDLAQSGDTSGGPDDGSAPPA